jgi:hypothetical protein
VNFEFENPKKKFDFGFFWVWIFGYLDFFGVLGFPSKSNPKTQFFWVRTSGYQGFEKKKLKKIS